MTWSVGFEHLPKMITNFRKKKSPLRGQRTHIFLSLLGLPSSISTIGSHYSLISSVPCIPALNSSVGFPNFLISPDSSSSLLLCWIAILLKFFYGISFSFIFFTWLPFLLTILCCFLFLLSFLILILAVHSVPFVQIFHSLNLTLLFLV